MDRLRCLIVSDTPCMKHDEGFKLFEPTLFEIEQVSKLVEEIRWATYVRDSEEGSLLRAPKAGNIYIEPLKFKRGGRQIHKKIGVILSLPLQMMSLIKKIRKVDAVHSRGPSVPAMLVILFSFFDSKRIYWHKYGGNWNEINSPAAYRLQRWLLKRLNKPNIRITVNGFWPGLHDGFISLENPCISEDVRRDNYNILNKNKNFDSNLSLCFVGNLDENKGAYRLLTVLNENPGRWPIEQVTFIGDGPLLSQLEQLAQRSSYSIKLLGLKSREFIFEKIFRTHHLLLLPSRSEGFPKVVAESAAHFCIPVVTNMSSLSQFIKHGENGFLMTDSTEGSIVECLDTIFSQRVLLEQISFQAWEMSSKFTYEHFLDRIKTEVLT